MASRHYSQSYTFQEIPPFVQYTSPVSSAPKTSGSPLPLNLIARIVSYLDDVGDIARVTRTSRLLYYMTLPQLYQKVSLHSYPEIRFVNGRPEGFGSGSPFMMALNGLSTKSHASVVRHFRLWGEWREVGVEDFAKGRIPDNSMLLNMMLRVACCQRKPHDSHHQIPLKRVPRPAVCIPAMPKLRTFKVIDFDPLCYPDDISFLIAGSKNLSDLRLHFSPRMRRNAEPTLNMGTFFSRCIKSGYMPKLKHFAMQNWFGPNTQSFNEVIDYQICKSMTFLDTFGGAQGGSANVYVDDTWRELPADLKLFFHTIRFNEFAPQHVALLQRSPGLEYCYIVNDRTGKPTMSTTQSPTSDYITPDRSPSTTSPDTAERNNEISSLGRDYLRALTTHHGSTLKHLLLSNQWPLSEIDLTNLIRSCPNLTQLGMVLGFPNHEILRLLMPFLPKLYALRILKDESSTASGEEPFVPEEKMVAVMGRDLYVAQNFTVKWVGVGALIFRCGGAFEHVYADGSTEMRRKVELVDPKLVKEVEIWRLDTLDIMAEDNTGG
ncbi:hypothetical protein WHR41_06546 [Cladosporium halotolerans]|uniref:F-box domain-containing protein n=1 Tax=Cladosporium halotolerans TaxID=1052096 RepID=A0AB34KNA1_9PEZI